MLLAFTVLTTWEFGMVVTAPCCWTLTEILLRWLKEPRGTPRPAELLVKTNSPVDRTPETGSEAVPLPGGLTEISVGCRGRGGGGGFTGVPPPLPVTCNWRRLLMPFQPPVGRHPQPAPWQLTHSPE